MKARTIYITEPDMLKLRALIEKSQRAQSEASTHIESLKAELNRASVVSPKDIPPDVITMRSRAEVKNSSTGVVSTYTLVFPAEANAESGLISILAPMGTAMLGYRQGDTIEWTMPAGKRTLEIVRVIYQPEAAGDFHL